MAHPGSRGLGPTESRPHKSKGTLAAQFAIGGAEGEGIESLQALLFGLGALGIWEQGASDFESAGGARATLNAYFADHQWSRAFAAQLGGLGNAQGCKFEGFELIIDRDWMATHRGLAQPVAVGRFIIDPREPDDHLGAEDSDLQVVVSEDSLVIQVPARRAFGTGSHETTRLVLRLMQLADLVGKRVLDVGCGTGVLSFAAHHLGSKSVVGYDVDPVSAVLAVENRALNGLPTSIQFFAGTAHALGDFAGTVGAFDVALVNVLPEKIEHQEAVIGAATGSPGEIVVSGLLDGHSSAASALKRWCDCGWSEVDRLVEGEWLAVRLRRSGSAG